MKKWLPDYSGTVINLPTTGTFNITQDGFMRPNTAAQGVHITINERYVTDAGNLGLGWFPVAVGDTISITGSLIQNIHLPGRWV